MKAGALRTQLLDLARRDGVPVRDVLVADASKRTTTVNAYVSGFGSTRRIVVYDTLLDSTPPAQIRLIVAHELGHAKRGDVLYGTLIGALGAAAGVCLLYLVVTAPAVRRRAGIGDAPLADARGAALLVAAVTVGSLLSSPAQNLVSRQIEARADAHALNLTADPATFARMQRDLSVRNLSDPTPDAFDYVMYATHPTGPQRIAMSRDWARLHNRPQPPNLAP
jgi:STE24 endopeptidase